jgi:hypothetical protein
MSYIEEIPCIEVLSAVVFIVEGVKEDTRNPAAIESHLNSCPNCRAEVEHEQAMHILMQDVLRRSCDEKAPDDLHRSIHEELLRQVSGAGVIEVVTQISMSEISIEIDEFGNVEHREIQIEQTQVQRFTDDKE